MKTLNQILEIVCERFNVTQEEILSKKRNYRIQEPKKVFCYLVRTIYGFKVIEVAQFLGIRHDVVSLHHHTMKKWVRTYPWWFEICDELEHKIICDNQEVRN